MISSNDKAMCVLPIASVATNATAYMSFSKVGNGGEKFDYANILFHIGAAATTSAVMTTLKLTESDTVTSASSMSAIVALTGGTATSSSVGFVIPTAQVAGGGLVEFQLDLRKRKKYLGLTATPAQTLVIGATALLSRASESQDTTTDKRISNLANTTAVSVGKLVTA
jgi:hypothetical protein